MAKKRTEKCIFPSRYSAGTWVTPAQYLAEILCERRAVSLQTTLPQKFWELDVWNKFYTYQIRLVNALLKIHSYKKILAALNKKQWATCWSYNNKAFKNYLKTFDFKEQQVVASKVENCDSDKQKPAFHGKQWADLRKKLS